MAKYGEKYLLSATERIYSLMPCSVKGQSGKAVVLGRYLVFHATGFHSRGASSIYPLENVQSVRVVGHTVQVTLTALEKVSSVAGVKSRPIKRSVSFETEEIFLEIGDGDTAEAEAVSRELKKVIVERSDAVINMIRAEKDVAKTFHQLGQNGMDSSNCHAGVVYVCLSVFVG